MQAPALTPLAAAVLHVGPAPERILEIECGEGDGVFFLAREFPAARVRGVDRDQGLVRAAARRVGLDPEGRVAFKVGHPRSLPYPSDFFDLVVLVDAPPPVAEVARVLRPGGHLIVSRSRDRGRDRGLRRRLARWRLGRHRIELCAGAAAGDGSFSVARLSGDGPAAPAD